MHIIKVIIKRAGILEFEQKHVHEDLSEQILSATMQPSGAGNQKFLKFINPW